MNYSEAMHKDSLVEEQRNTYKQLTELHLENDLLKRKLHELEDKIEFPNFNYNAYDYEIQKDKQIQDLKFEIKNLEFENEFLKYKNSEYREEIWNHELKNV